MITLRNIILGLKDQLPLRRMIRNMINGKIWGLFHKRSHLRDNGEAKIMYGSRESATKAAKKMEEKRGFHFSVYKCIYCNGYHIGANRYIMRKNNET